MPITTTFILTKIRIVTRTVYTIKLDHSFMNTILIVTTNNNSISC